MKNFVAFLVAIVAPMLLAGATMYLTGDIWRSSDRSLQWMPPSASDTLAGISATQTLTNKTMSGSSNTFTNVSLTTAVTGTLPLGNGGTGQTSASAAINALVPTQSGNTGKCLSTNGSSVLWDACGGGGGGAASVPAGGTGFTSATAHGVVLGNGTSPLSVTGPGTTGQAFVSGGSGADGAFGTLGAVGGGTGQTAYTNGQLLIGNTTSGGLDKAIPTGGNGISISIGAGSLTISAPSKTCDAFIGGAQGINSAYPVGCISSCSVSSGSIHCVPATSFWSLTPVCTGLTNFNGSASTSLMFDSGSTASTLIFYIRDQTNSGNITNLGFFFHCAGL